MNRRALIQQLALLSVGAVMLPACMGDHSKPDLVLKNFKITGDQEKLLAELTATLIPTTSTPGAREVSAHLFVLKMMDDCFSPEDQARFFKGMAQLDLAARSALGSSFTAADGPRRESLLQTIETGKLPGEELGFFYSTTKKQTILAYSSSSWFLTKIQVYELVPGRFHGCVPVPQQQRQSAS